MTRPEQTTRQILDSILAPELLANLPASDERAKLLRLIKQRFEEAHENPPVEQLEAVVRARFTVDRARALLFQPSIEEFGSFYRFLIRDPPVSAPSNHPQRVLQVLFLGSFYFLHQKQPELLAEFVTSGGVLELVPLLVTENPYIRGHAIEILHAITSSEHLDWFNTERINKKWHRCLLELARTPITFNLLENRECALPEGSLLCLQILAFWLSWVRFFYCKENVLRLDKRVLEGLRTWSAKEVGAGVTQEEIDLAEKLYEDFSRFPIQETEPSAPAESALLLENPTTEYTAALPDNPRELGNLEYKEGNYAEAIRLYGQALALAGESEDSETLAKLHCNLSAAHLELGKALGTDEHLWLAVKCGETALSLEKFCPKATYRLFKAYEKLNQVESARTHVEDLLASEEGSLEERRMLTKIHAKFFKSQQENSERQLEKEEIIRAVLRRIGASEVYSSNCTIAKSEGQDDGPTLISSRDRDREAKTGPCITAEKPAVPQSASPGKMVQNRKERIGARSDVYGEELEERHIVDTIEAVDKLLPQEPSSAVELLDSLAQSKRFQIVIMFLDTDMQKRLVAIFQILAGLLSSETSQARKKLQTLRKAFRVPI